MPRPDAHTTDLQRLAADIEAFAERLGAPCDRARVARTLDVFQRGFRHCPVELRTTTVKPGKRVAELSFRYVDPRGAHDPYQVAVDAGLLRPSGRPVDALVPELQRRFRIFGYGLDASAGHGMEKIWPLFDSPRPLDDALAVASLPASVARSAPWLRRHRLTRVCIIAADYRHESVNLYFPMQGLYRDAGELASVIDDLGFARPSPEALAQDLRAMIVNVSYVWGRDSVERICFYRVAEGAADVPGDPVLRAAIEAAPGAAKGGRFILGSSYGKEGGYTKLELDYTGTSVPLFQRWVEKQSALERPLPSAIDVARDAKRASSAWAAAGVARRLSVLERAGRALAARRDDLHAALRADSLSTDLARYWGDWLTHAADPEVLAHYADQMIRWVPAGEGGEILVRRPDGVVLLIPPGNSPTINGSSVFSILLAGNAVIARAPENDLGMRLIFEEVLQPALAEAGFARAVASLVRAKSREILASFAPLPEVRTIVFFGNADAGREVMALAQKLGKKAVMELEGSDHMIVWRDADLPRAIESAGNGLQGSSQPCVVPKHFLVHGAVFDRFTASLCDKARAAATVEEDPEHGLLVPIRAPDRFEAALREVREVGEVLTGGHRMNGRREPDPEGLYAAPTVVALTREAVSSRALLCFDQEISFPLLPVVRVDGEDEVALDHMIDLAGQSPFGLRASVWARDPEVIARLVAGLGGVGLVVVNRDHAKAPERVSPWGGPGRSGGPYGESHFFWEKTSRLQAIASSELSLAEVERVLAALGATGAVARRA